MKVIDWIDVGTIAAERDENLKHYFYDAGISKKIINSPNMFLMLGRKGAGKTAVFKHLSDKPKTFFEDNDIVVALSLNSYSWNVHGLLSDEKKGGSYTFRDSWRFVIMVEAIRSLINDHANKKIKVDAKIRAAGTVLEKLFAKPVPSWKDLLGEKLFSLSRIKLPSASTDLSLEGISLEGGEISFEEMKGNAGLRDSLSKNIENLTNYLERVLLESLKDSRIFILFDRLDEAWETGSMETCKLINTGLIQAGDYVTQKFQGKIRPIVFLREDIFIMISLNDKNKLREDCGALLMWDRESLQKMILMRINYYARLNAQPDTHDLQALFDRKEMRSRTTPVNYIIQRSFMRPRDVICFYKKLIESIKADIEEQNNGLFEEEIEKKNLGEKLNVDTIYEAETAYSKWLKDELIEEWETQFSPITPILDGIENIGKSIIRKEELLAVLKTNDLNVDNAWIRKTMNFLYLTSVIGFKKGKSALWKFKCFNTGQSFNESDYYRIHYGLIRGMGLTESSVESSLGEKEGLQIETN